MYEPIYRRLLLTLSILVILFLAIGIIRSLNDRNANDRLLKKYLNDAKQQSQKIIDQRQKNIELLLKNVYKLEIEIDQKQRQIDSLKRQKNKIEYIYIQTIKKINEYDAKQLEEYWRNELP